MISLVILGGIAALLWVLAFLSKRRFGLLGLALTAGATVSSLWSYDAGLLLASLGLVPEGPITDAAVLSAITLLPAILLLFHGHVHHRLIGRVFGATFFVLMAMALLVEPIGVGLPVTGVGAQLYSWLQQYSGVIISAGVILSVFDLLLVKVHKPAEKSDKKKK